MAQKTETANATVFMDGSSAKAELEKIKIKLTELRAEKKKFEESGDIKGFKNAEKDIASLTSQQRQLKNQTMDVNQIMKNLNNTSLKDLEKAYRSLSAEIKGSGRNAEHLGEKVKASKAIKSEIDSVKASYYGLGQSQDSFFSKASAGFNKYAGLVAGATASFAGLLLAGKAMIKEFETFEDASANLSSLTGLKGEDLKYMEDASKQMSVSSKEGIKFTQSADQILQAMTVIGSVKSELLKDKEALKEVTQEGLILAAAAKMETGPALESLGNTMNQFNAPASEAKKYINVLAAGSKEGAAEINVLAESFVKAGTVMKMANLTIEQSTAIFETLADKGMKGADAGTALRGVLIKLQSGADEFNPKVVGLDQALQNLSNANLSVAERTKLFGQEGIVAGSILIDNRARVTELTKAVTGTNTAYEQASINTNTHSATMAQATNHFKIQAIELGQKLAPALAFSTNLSAKFLKVLVNFPTILKENKTLFVGLAVAMVVMNAAKIKGLALSALEHISMQKGIGLKIKEKIQLEALIFMEEYHRISMLKGATATNIFTIAANGLKAAWATSPLGLIAVAAGALFMAFSALNSKTEETTDKARGFANAQEVISENLTNEKAKIMAVVGQYADYEKNMESRKNLIKYMNDNYGDYLTNLLTEKSTNEDIANAINLVNAALENKIKYAAYNDELVEVIKQQLKVERLMKSFASPERAMYSSQQAFDMAYQTWEATSKASWDASQKGLTDLKAEKDKIFAEMRNVSTLIKSSSTPNQNAPGIPTGPIEPVAPTAQKGAYELLGQEISELTKKYQNLIAMDKSGQAVNQVTLDQTVADIKAKTAQKAIIDRIIETQIGSQKSLEKEKTAWEKIQDELTQYNKELQELMTKKQQGEQVNDAEISRLANEIKQRTILQKKIQEQSAAITAITSVYDAIVARTTAIDKAMTADVVAGEQLIYEAIKNGKMKAADLEEQRAKVREDAEDKAYITQMFYLEKQLRAFKGSADERKKVEEDLQKLKSKMMDKDFKKFLTIEEKKKKAEEKKRELIRKGEEILINSVGQLVGNSIEANKNKELAKVDETTNAKKTKLEAEKTAGIITEEEYIRKLALVEKDAAAEKIEIEKKAKLWSIAADAAVGIAKAIAESPLTGGLPMSGIIAAEAILQAGVVQLSPQFRKGNIPGTIPVMGADDHQIYNATPGGSAQTGFYNKPTLLVSEDATGGSIGEMVVSQRDLQNPAVMQHAKAIAHITETKQYRNGNTPDYVSGTSNNQLIAFMKQIAENTSNSYNFRDLDETLLKVKKKKDFETSQFKG